MPKAWSKKRERQYEHIKQSELEQGRSSKRAEEIAAATVNKQRRKAGETKGGRRKGAGRKTQPRKKPRKGRKAKKARKAK